MASEDITYDVQSVKSAFTGSTLNISSKSSKSTVLANELDKYVSYNAIWT